MAKKQREAEEDVNRVVDEAAAFQREEDLRSALKTAQIALMKSKNRTDDLVAATITACRDATLSMGRIPEVKAPKADTRKRAEVALWHLTDFQGAKVTPSYNSEVMRARAFEYVRRAEKVTTIQRANHPVRHCVIAFGGDMIEGLWNFPSQPFEIDTSIFGQFVNVSRLLVEVVREALRIYETVQVVGEWGNHGRIGSKRDCVPRSDNFDRMCYEMARQLLKDEQRLVWQDCPEDIQRIEVGNYKALLIHGDEVGRNGFASKMSITQHANRWRSGAYRVNGQPYEFRDVLVGHYHTHEEMSLANGEGSVYYTGSLESDNRYASVGLASCAIPSQRLHFIDPERGRTTATYKIWLGDDE